MQDGVRRHNVGGYLYLGMPMDLLISFDDLKVGAKALKKLVQAFTRAGAPVASTDVDPRTRRTSGINYRQVLITFTDNQSVTLGVKTTGDIFEVKVNSLALPIKAQDDQKKAVAEIVQALDSGRAKFQAKLAAQKVALPKGITTAAPRMEAVLQEAQAQLDQNIESAKARVNELRAELGDPLLDAAGEKLAGTKSVAQRMATSMAWLVDTLKESGKITDDQAEVAATYYLKHKLVKLDPVSGRGTFKHGAFLDEDVIKRSLTLDSATSLLGETLPTEPLPDGKTWLGFKVMDRQSVMDEAASNLPAKWPIAGDVNVLLDDGGNTLRVAGTVVSTNFRAGKVLYSVAVPISPQPQSGRQMYAVIADVPSELVAGRGDEAAYLDSVGFADELKLCKAPVLAAAAGEALFDTALTGAEIDVLAKLARGPAEDGDIPSKSGRDSLVERGLIERADGMNTLTDKGTECAALLDATAVAANSFADENVIEARRIAAQIIAGDTLDDATYAAAIAQLQVALDVVETNYPINLAEGNLAQADLEERSAEDFRKAIALLESARAAAEAAA